MPNAIINQIKLPDNTVVDLRDASALHYIGKTTTALTNNATTNPISINSTNVTAVVNDYVLANDAANNSFYWDGAKWVLMDPAAAEVPVKAVKVDSTALTPDGAGAVNITDIPAYCITAPTSEDETTHETIYTKTYLTSGVRAHTPTADDHVANKGYVDSAIADIPEPMIFKGGVTLTADSSTPTTAEISIDDTTITSIKLGYTFKVATIATTTPPYSGTLKEGDTLIANKANPKTTADWTSADWTVIPSGDENNGTVLSVATSNVGITTADGQPISESGTISLKLASTSALSGTAVAAATEDRIFPVAVDGSANGNLAVAISKGTLAQTVSDATSGHTVVTAVTAEAPSASPTGLVYYNVDSTNGILSLYDIRVADDDHAVFDTITP